VPAKNPTFRFFVSARAFFPISSHVPAKNPTFRFRQSLLPHLFARAGEESSPAFRISKIQMEFCFTKTLGNEKKGESIFPGVSGMMKISGAIFSNERTQG